MTRPSDATGNGPLGCASEKVSENALESRQASAPSRFFIGRYSARPRNHTRARRVFGTPFSPARSRLAFAVLGQSGRICRGLIHRLHGVLWPRHNWMVESRSNLSENCWIRERRAATPRPVESHTDSSLIQRSKQVCLRPRQASFCGKFLGLCRDHLIDADYAPSTRLES